MTNTSLVLQESMLTCMHPMLRSNMHAIVQISLQDSMPTCMHPMLHSHMHHMHANRQTMYAAYSHACNVHMRKVSGQLAIRIVVVR